MRFSPTMPRSKSMISSMVSAARVRSLAAVAPSETTILIRNGELTVLSSLTMSKATGKMNTTISTEEGTLTKERCLDRAVDRTQTKPTIIVGNSRDNRTSSGARPQARKVVAVEPTKKSIGRKCLTNLTSSLTSRGRRRNLA